MNTIDNITRTADGAGFTCRHSVDLQIEMTAYQMAEAFWSMDKHTQAMFFIKLGYFYTKDPAAFEAQMQSVGQVLRVDPEGAFYAMQTIGEATYD